MRLLFVDDDPILREFAAVHLASETVEVRTVGDGDEALAMLGEWPVDLMLLDLEMPRVDGFEVLERLAANPAHRDLPVIVVTGREDIAAIDRAFAVGATSFVCKPLNWRLLAYQIRYVRRARAAVAKAEARLADLARETGRLLQLAGGEAPSPPLAALRAMLEPLANRAA
ncbi:MAG TPA: response regulator [Caulobacteraceae bacterium]|nr:response regulator [Caulobacteraceae bacterium]